MPRQPDYQPHSSPSSRPAQPNTSWPAQPSTSRPDSYFPGVSTSGPADKQLSALHALERHLNEVEKKLDKIIGEMESARKPVHRKAADMPGAGSKPELSAEPEDVPASPFKRD